MELTFNDGRKISKPYDEVEFAQADSDSNCVKTTIYKPGAIVEMSDRRYRVDSHGNLRRM